MANPILRANGVGLFFFASLSVAYCSPFPDTYADTMSEYSMTEALELVFELDNGERQAKGCIDIGDAGVGAESNRDPNPIVPLWAGLLRVGLDQTKCWQVSNTDNALPSILFIFTNPPPVDNKNPSPAQRAWAMTRSIASGSYKIDPPKNCGASGLTFNDCCLQSPHPECINQFSWNFCKQEFCTGMHKLGAAMSIFVAFSNELARNSVAIPKSGVFRDVPGDKVFLIWPYMAKNEQEDELVYLRTEITGDLVDRLYVLADSALPTIRRIDDRKKGTTKLSCSLDGQVFGDFEFQPEELTEVFYSGIGRETSASTPPGTAERISTSLYIELGSSYTRMATLDGVRKGVGSGNKDFVQFAEIGRQYKERLFHCIPRITMGEIFEFRSLLNNPESSTFVFGLAFLRAFYLEAYK